MKLRIRNERNQLVENHGYIKNEIDILRDFTAGSDVEISVKDNVDVVKFEVIENESKIVLNGFAYFGDEPDGSDWKYNGELFEADIKEIEGCASYAPRAIAAALYGETAELISVSDNSIELKI